MSQLAKNMFTLFGVVPPNGNGSEETCFSEVGTATIKEFATEQGFDEAYAVTRVTRAWG
jgi:hypothetical protein